MKRPKKVGPKPAAVQIEGRWRDAIKKALRKPRPAEGWPDSAPETTGTAKPKTPKKKRRK